MSTTNTCDKCKFFVDNRDTDGSPGETYAHGFCRRYPPTTPVRAPEDNELHWYFAEVYTWDWCGEFSGVTHDTTYI